jgi:hypothetical protein
VKFQILSERLCLLVLHLLNILLNELIFELIYVISSWVPSSFKLLIRDSNSLFSARISIFGRLKNLKANPDNSNINKLSCQFLANFNFYVLYVVSKVDDNISLNWKWENQGNIKSNSPFENELLWCSANDLTFIRIFFHFLYFAIIPINWNYCFW